MRLVLELGAVPDHLVASRHRRRCRSIAASGVQTCGRQPAGYRLASTPASILSVFMWAWTIAFTCSGLAVTTRARCSIGRCETTIALPVASITTSWPTVTGQSPPGRCGSCRPGRQVAAGRRPDHRRISRLAQSTRRHRTAIRRPGTASARPRPAWCGHCSAAPPPGRDRTGPARP